MEGENQRQIVISLIDQVTEQTYFKNDVEVCSREFALKTILNDFKLFTVANLRYQLSW